MFSFSLTQFNIKIKKGPKPLQIFPSSPWKFGDGTTIRFPVFFFLNHLKFKLEIFQ